jgi:hypothetical protein
MAAAAGLGNHPPPARTLRELPRGPVDRAVAGIERILQAQEPRKKPRRADGAFSLAYPLNGYC